MELIHVDRQYPVVDASSVLNSPTSIYDEVFLPRNRYESPAKGPDVKSVTADTSAVNAMRKNSEICLWLGAEIYEELASLNPYQQGHGMSSSSSSDSVNSIFTQSSLGSPSSEIWISPKDKALKALVPEKLNVPIKEGHQYQLAVERCDCTRLAHSRMASFEYDDMIKRQISRINVPEKITELDAIDLNEEVLGPVGAHKKKLFGENGWLEDASDAKGLRRRQSKAKMLKNFGKKIKQHMEELAEDVARTYPGALMNASSPTRIMQQTTAPITLDPTTQAKLYSELELMICNTANEFLLHQYYDNRVSQESIKKINSFWGSKNRPRVTEFHFDQTTQRELILANLRTLQFRGECSANPVLLHSNLQNWKAIAKEMSVRTFCLPDSAIRKHLHDMQKLLEMLDAPISTLEAFHTLQVQVQGDIIKRLKMAHHPRSNFSISY